MKFILFVEGHTESKVVPAFLKRWLDKRLSRPVGVKAVRFQGWPEFIREVSRKALLYLEGPGTDDVIAVIGLLDLYGPTIYPPGVDAADDRVAWATDFLENSVRHGRYRQFFAVHELEAWLLSQPTLFPSAIREALRRAGDNPETVDFNEPPAQLLDRLYKTNIGSRYKKVTYGQDLFGKLDPERAYEACPNLRRLLDEMLALATAVES